MAMIPPAEISLKDIASHCEVKTSCLDEEVTSAYYHEVSRYLSKWKLIAPKLKFTDDEIESIDQDNLTAEMKRISFVKEWKQKFAMKATYRALMESLLGIKRVQDATGVCQVLKDSQNSNVQGVCSTETPNHLEDSGGNVEADSGVEETDGRNPTSAKWKDELTKTVQEGQKTKARGLAVVIYISYENCLDITPLPGAIKDGLAMMDTFKSLQFAVLPIHNATKEDIREIIREVASYANYPEEYDCFSIVFAGHGDENSILLAIDGKFDFDKVIVERLNPKVHKSGVSKKIASVHIIAFIDACRGKMRPRARLNERNIPNNMMLCYSTREEDESFENADGGIWMQKIARELKQQIKPVGEIVASVNRDVKNQNPIYMNTGVDITLKKAIHSEGQRIEEEDNSGADETDGIHKTSTCFRSWKCSTMTLVSILVVLLAIYFVLYMN